MNCKPRQPDTQGAFTDEEEYPRRRPTWWVTRGGRGKKTIKKGNANAKQTSLKGGDGN